MAASTARPETRSKTHQLSLALSACAAALGCWAIALLTGSAVDTSPSLFVLACVAIVWAAAGIVVTVRHHCPAALIISSVALTLALGAACFSLDATKVLADSSALIADLGQRLSMTMVAALAFHLALTLPDGHVSRASHRRFVVAAYITSIAVGLALLADRDEVSVWPLLVLWAVVLSAAPVAHANYRAAGIIDQRRMQWIGWAAVVAAEVILVSVALSLVADWPNHVGAISLAASGLIPIALAAGTLSRLLARIDRLLTHTVSLAGLSALIVIAYLIALAAFGRRPDDSERSLLLLSMLASAGAAIAHQPARTWLTDRANRVVYGERISPDEALRTWGARLTRAIPLDELLLQLAETLRKSMQLRSAQIWAGTDGHYEVAAMVPHRNMKPYEIGDKERSVVSRAGVSGGTWLDIWLPGLVEKSNTSTRVAPIAHSGELLGLIVCERPADRANFTEEDDRVLTELSRQVGLALHNVQLDTALQASLDELRDANDELRASRVRIVAAGDAERRKLERNLHDGAQQHLVALAVKLRLAKDSVVDDPADAEAMIDEIRGDLQTAIAELRALAHGIFPPLLMSGGLAEALPAAAARAALPTTTDIVVGRHQQEVEAAVYFCCMEAMQNSGKHAGDAASSAIKVWETDSTLHWEVTDDGPGFDAKGDAGSGHGFVNMRDRMGSFGGTIEVVSSAGSGTTVRGQLPLDSPSATH
ncbi:MAG: GAF domain-containing protein [Actinomycetia bacterium]|nr:GAF domain-containing protein [Actinomycetes bacterium]